MNQINQTLYRVSSTRKILEWSVYVDGPSYTTISGYTDGKKQTHTTNIKEMRNSKSLEEQAVLEATSQWNLKRKTMYPTIEEAFSAHAGRSLSLGGYSPMLAKELNPKKPSFSIAKCFEQPKLDGCLAGNSKVYTEIGHIPIKKIVDNKMKIKVLSYNESSHEMELKNILNWFDNGKESFKNWIYVTPTNGKYIRCTKNHKFLTASGWKEASELNSDTDKIYHTSGSHYRNCLIAGTVLGDSIISIDKRSIGRDPRISFRHSNIEYFNEKLSILNLSGKTAECVSGYGSECKVFTSDTISWTEFPVEDFYEVKSEENLGKRIVVGYKKTLSKYITKEALSLWICDDGSVLYNNGNRDTPRLSISTYRYTNEQLEEFIKLFEKKYKVVPSIQFDKRLDTNASNSSLFFTTKDTLYLLNMLRPYQIKSMAYKFYFPASGYIKTANDDYAFSTFKVKKSSNMLPTTRYDIEVEDNHNYVADGIVVHNCRAIARKIDGEVLLSARSGAIKTTTPHINEQLSEVMLDGEIWDGEIYKHGMELEDILSLVQSSKNRKDTTSLEYHVYDFPRVGELNELAPFSSRLDAFQNRFYADSMIHDNVVAVQTRMIKDFDEADQHHTEYVEDGYEGTILRNPLAGYENKRTKNLLKFKKFQDAEFPIIGVEEGKGKLEGHAGAFICQMPDGRTFKAKMEGEISALQKYLDHPENVVGKMLTVRFFALTKHGIPRFPVGVRIRGED